MKGLLTAYMTGVIGLPPIKKIRVLCEILMGIPLAEDAKTKIDDIYAVSIALDGCSTQDSPLCVPWPFSPTKENFDRYIAPWLKTMPDFEFANELDRDLKLKRVIFKTIQVDGKTVTVENEPWEQFFIITSRVGLSPVALGELRSQFAKWAITPVMREITKVLETRGLAQDLDLEKPARE